MRIKSDKKLISRFHNKSGYTIWVEYDETHEVYHIYVDCSKRKLISWSWGVYSGSKDDHNVHECLELFDMTVSNIKSKTARRYFLRTVREFPMHEYKIKDFLNNCKNTVDWEKVYEYEKQYYLGPIK